jgi:hypothetical protein
MIQYIYNLFSECFRKKDVQNKYTGHVEVIYK